MAARCIPGHFRAVVGGLAAAALLAFLVANASASEHRRSPIVRAVQAAGPSVVNIHGQKAVARPADPNHPRQVNGMGTGVVIDPRGYILTNFHVVDGVRRINVGLEGGQSTVARIIARDRSTDIAVIKIDPPFTLPVIRIGTSRDLMRGETVIALGNAYGYAHTVTRGIISALHRNVEINDSQQYNDLIQTDASINPGNSGGPLLNIDGEMIGLNVAVRAGAQNIGFAIPIDKTMQIAARLMSVERHDGNWHGLQLNAAGVDGKPAVVKNVDSGSPAHKLGIEPGDEIERVGSVATSRALDVERALLGRATGKSTTLVVRRDGRLRELSLTLVPQRGITPAQPPTESFDRAWDVLGLELAEVPAAEFPHRRSRFEGGLRVVSVRQRSAAATQGIRSGDILVGMHGWRTESRQDIHYIITRPNLTELSPLKFYILREGEPRTLYGHLRLTEKQLTNAETSAK